MLENVAMASATYTSMKARSLDYALGSGLECAACLDLARIKRLLDARSVCSEKEELSQLLRMLVGLRKAWTGAAHAVREETTDYPGPEEGIDEACDKDRDEAWWRSSILRPSSAAPHGVWRSSARRGAVGARFVTSCATHGAV